MRPFHLLTCFGALLTALSVFLCLKQGSAGVVASNTYFGPTTKVPGNPQLVKVEVLVKDSSDAAGPQVLNVEFNQVNIPLKPRDIYGNRGTASFQVPPGSYKLRWTTNVEKMNWPRNKVHEEIITISPRDLWIQIQIDGENASIS